MPGIVKFKLATSANVDVIEASLRAMNGAGVGPFVRDDAGTLVLDERGRLSAEVHDPKLLAWMLKQSPLAGVEF